jgi:hypothetical protein
MNVEYRFSENRAAVLKMCDCVGNYRVKGLDHRGNKFRTSIGQWNKLELATEKDYCEFFKRDNHISNNSVTSSGSRSFKMQITETTPNCRPHYPMSIEAHSEDVPLFLEFIGKHPWFNDPDLSFVPMPSDQKFPELTDEKIMEFRL